MDFSFSEEQLAIRAAIEKICARFDAQRYFRDSLIPRIVPVSPQLILCYIAERVLGLPKSY
jgi:hypothetical protein